jgi:hypothetical protein
MISGTLASVPGGNRPSIQPSSRNRCTKASSHSLPKVGVGAPMKPIVGTFPGCCARAASGHAAAAPPSREHLIDVQATKREYQRRCDDALQPWGERAPMPRADETISTYNPPATVTPRLILAFCSACSITAMRCSRSVPIFASMNAFW